MSTAGVIDTLSDSKWSLQLLWAPVTIINQSCILMPCLYLFFNVMFYVIRIIQIIWCSCWMTQLVYQFVLATNASYFPIMIKDLILWPAETNCLWFWRQMKSNKKMFLTKTVAYLYLAMHLTIEKLSSHDVHDNHNRSILLYSSTQHRRLTLLAACVTSACTKLSPVLSAVCHVDRSSVETMLTSCGCSPHR